MKWFDGPYPFNDLAGADVDEFLCTLEKAKLHVKRSVHERRRNFVQRTGPPFTKTLS
jgi:hypothetical protein